MRFAWTLAATSATALTGCRFDLPEAGVSDAVLSDAPLGGCYGAPSGLVRPCFASAPTGNITLPGTIDTDTSTLCGAPMSGGNGYCVVAANNITLDDSVAATGTKPLVLVAVSTITIEAGATLDVASHHSTIPPRTGAGAGSTDCMAGTPPMASGAGGGGAGGAFGGAAGSGGAGNNGAGAAGTPGAVQVATTLRGGCPGQDGINGTFGIGGKGGGAVYLIATRISISGAINASGEGGRPGLTGSAGGGGGGSGGMIGLDAPMITNSGNVFANGASGGEGSGTATPGNLGPEPTSTAASPPPTSGTNNGGDGGGGSGTGIPTGRNGSNGSGGGSPGGGGGGGGGLGVIKVYRGTLTGNVSPNPS
ncbi:MAG TPA: hypothetical protein VK932_09390 [Kofleriaceae bacterium]|nr:hypothetical protein [Kofleriaceae bacterium]